MKRGKRKPLLDWWEATVGGIVTLIIIGLVFVFAYDECSVQPRLQRECEDRGGRVVELHGGSRGPRWFCEEPKTPNAERAP